MIHLIVVVRVLDTLTTTSDGYGRNHGASVGGQSERQLISNPHSVVLLLLTANDHLSGSVPRARVSIYFLYANSLSRCFPVTSTNIPRSSKWSTDFRIVGADNANERAAAGTDKIGLVFRNWRTCKADPAGRPSFSIAFRSLSKRARISFAACAA